MGDTTRRRTDRSSLVRTFALRAAVLFVAAALVLFALVTRAVEQEFRDAASFHAAFVVDAILEPELQTQGDMTGEISPEAAALIGERIRDRVLDDELVYHVTIWTADGDLIASDDPAHVGRRAVTLGDTTSELLWQALDTGEAVSVEGPARYVMSPPSANTLRTFVAFDGGQPLVAEVHGDWAPTLVSADRFSRTLAWPLGGLLLAVWLLLLPIARLASRQLRHVSRTDDLTGLPNRASLEDRLSAALDRLDRRDRELAVLFIDLDGFKQVNDTLGHAAGDALLRDVAEALGRRVRRPDVLARFAGDEFVLVLEETSRDLAEQVARRLLHAVHGATSLIDGVSVSASVGVVLTGDPDTDVDELLRQADAAMYEVKAIGGDAFRVFDDVLRAEVAERAWIEGDLPRAAERGELELHFQPFVGLQGDGAGSATAVEALLRWTHPVHGRVSPGQFIPVAERNGQIVALGAWVVEAACRQAAAWQDQLGPDRPFRVFANLSAVQLTAAFLHQLDNSIAATGVDPVRLGFEVTETAVLEDDAEVVAVLEGIRARGCLLALDDFGTGYSSLSRLQTLPLDLLKLDASFVTSLEPGSRERAIVTAVHSIARELDVQVLAEGIETQEQYEAVQQLGFDLAQGYLLERPAPAHEVAVWLDPRHVAAATTGGTAPAAAGV